MTQSRKPLPSGSFSAQVSALDHEGRGVARIDGKVTFIADALPGETVQFRYTNRLRDLDEGQVTTVTVASPDRVTPPCLHFGLCGGCVLQHLAPAKQLAWKQKQLTDALARIGKLNIGEIAPPLIGSNSFGYRRRARLTVKVMPKKGGMLVGFRERQSSFLAAIDSCIVLDPRVGTKLTAIAAMLDSLSIREQIPQIEVAASDHVCLVLRVMHAPSAQDLATLRAFGAEQNFEFFLQPRGLDSIAPLDAPARGLSYSPDGSDTRLAFEPNDFIQVNGPLSQAMVRQALDWLALKAGEKVLELFAGLGNFTVPMANTGALVTAVEGDASLVQRGRANCTANGVQVNWQIANLFEPDLQDAYLRESYDAVLLDPPRAGAQIITPLIARKKPRRIVYVSCHPGTLARDAGALVDAGYRLLRVGAMDMFPHTSHVESMALFVRK